MGLLVLLTFCETPLWCLHTGATASQPWSFFPAQETCPATDGGFIGTDIKSFISAVYTGVPHLTEKADNLTATSAGTIAERHA